MIGTFARAFGVAGAAVGVAAAGLVAGLKEVSQGLVEISNQARIAGVGLKSFQELKHVAESARIGVDALTDGLKEMNLRADEFITSGGKSGSAAEAFKRLGYTAEQLREKLKDPSALFSEIIGKMGEFQKASQVRLSDEIFGGTGGEQFVKLIEQGAQGIRRTIDEANSLGIVLDDKVIARAEEIDRLFNLIASTVGTNLKGYIIEATVALGDFIKAFNGFQAERSESLDGKLGAIAAQRLDVERQIAALREQQRQGQVGAGDGIFGTSIGESTAGEAIADHERRLEALGAEEDMIRKIIDARKQAASLSDSQTPTVLKEIEVNADAAADAYDALIQSANERIQQMELEISLGGRAGAAADGLRMKQDMLTKAMDEHGTVLPERRAEIEGLSERYGALALAYDKVRLAGDLLFEREQMGRSGTEQRVASEMRSLYGDDYAAYMDSAIAGEIRFNETLDETIRQMKSVNDLGKQTFTGLIDVLTSAGDRGEKLVSVFASIGKAFSRADRSAIARAIGLSKEEYNS